MKAAVVWKHGDPITIENVTVFKPKNREVLVNTAYAGICHSDLHIHDGTYPHPLPYIPGHEASGIVEGDVRVARPWCHGSSWAGRARARPGGGGHVLVDPPRMPDGCLRVATSSVRPRPGTSVD